MTHVRSVLWLHHLPHPAHVREDAGARAAPTERVDLGRIWRVRDMLTWLM